MAFTISASDSDNDPLTFSLTGANAGYFTVDSNTGVVSILRELDREVCYGKGKNHSVVSFILILCVCVLSV